MSITQFKDTNIIGELTINGIPVQAGVWEDTILIDSRSVAASQLPSVVDTPLQVEFGGSQTSPGGEVSLSAAGRVTFNETGSYLITSNFRLGRTGASGTSVIVGQFFYNGVAIPQLEGAAARIDNANLVVPLSLTFVIHATAGDFIEVFIARDSSGANSGGLFQFTPTTLPWNDAPSASIRVSRLLPIE